MTSSDGLYITLGEFQLVRMGKDILFQISLISVSVTYLNVDFDRSLFRYAYQSEYNPRHELHILFFKFFK